MRVFTALVLSLFLLTASAQKKIAFVSGQVIDENENPVAKVSVVIVGKTSGTLTNDSGFFRIKVTAAKATALIFSYTGYAATQKNFYLSDNEEEKITIRLQKDNKTLQTVVVSNDRERKELGLTKINPKNAIVLPSTTGGIEGLIKILVGSNNELTSQYSVRGGNYDENLIYINDFEIFRPYLVRSGQQEGLSFINPELARNVNFITTPLQVLLLFIIRFKK
jgi:CarboxypepD_reg-like domain